MPPINNKDLKKEKMMKKYTVLLRNFRTAVLKILYISFYIIYTNINTVKSS